MEICLTEQKSCPEQLETHDGREGQQARQERHTHKKHMYI